jgi:antirestriction protein ArdC
MNNIARWTSNNSMSNAAVVAPIDAAEEVVRHVPNPPSIKYGGRVACYFPSRDEVQVPDRRNFTDGDEFYSTLFHELAHSTGHESRLDREGVTTNWAFGSNEYSEEELIAEMTSSFLCGFAGIGQKTMPNTTAYIGAWLRKLQADPRYIVKAASKAQKAADFILCHHHEDPG